MTDPTSPVSATTPSQRPAPGPVRGGSSSNIHLWQFVKELLNRAEHSGCIHWVDRDQGIFKIVDSVRVAELWGKRKNRPAMNFDKLSRSLRQYYKKGIMKKTSRPQRLVYQFCSPYHKWEKYSKFLFENFFHPIFFSSFLTRFLVWKNLCLKTIYVMSQIYNFFSMYKGGKSLIFNVFFHVSITCYAIKV